MIEHGYSKKMIIKDKLLIKRLKKTKITIKNNKSKVNLFGKYWKIKIIILKRKIKILKIIIKVT